MNRIISFFGGITILSPLGGYVSYKALENHILTIAFVFIFFLSLAITISWLYNKYQSPKCGTCNYPLHLLSKTSIAQEEIIKRGTFIFTHTYQYHYHCEHCKKDIDIIKKK